MNWDELHNVKSVDEMIDFFDDRIKNDTENLKREIEGELETLYIRMGNDHEGRGVVGENSLISTTASLEAVRALCIEQLKVKG